MLLPWSTVSTHIRPPAAFRFCALAFLAYCISFSSNAFAQSNTSSASALNCDSAYASPDSLWPPNHKYKNISIGGIVGAEQGENLQTHIHCIRQDEVRNGNGDGNTNTDAKGIDSGVARVRAERQGGGNGRVYHIGFTATGSGNRSCSGVVTVGVPSSKKKTPVDDGPLYGSSPDHADCALVDVIADEVVAITSTPPAEGTVGSQIAYAVVGSSSYPDSVLSYSLASAPSGAQIDSVTGELTWTPGAAGVENFVVTLTSSTGVTINQSFAISVEDLPNLPPVALAQSVTGSEDTDLTIALAGTDPEAATLTFTVVEAPQNGILTGTAPALVYTPNTNFVGEDNFSFVVSDGLLESAVAQVNIVVSAVNDAPVAQNLSLVAAEDSAVAVSLVGNDIDGDQLSFNILSSPSSGALDGTPPNLNYIPAPDFNGDISFQYSVSDGEADSPPATVAIAVEPINDQPVGIGQSINTSEGTPISISLDATDVDGDSLSFDVVAQPSNGALSGTAPSLSYVPNAGFTGTDSFEFRVFDGLVYSENAIVTVEVVTDDRPVAQAISESVEEDGGTLISFEAYDSEGVRITFSTSVSFSVVSQPANGTITPRSTRQIVYRPNPGFIGSDEFSYIANDGESDSAPAIVSIDVFAKNKLPVAITNEDFTIDFGQTAEMDGSESYDPDGDALTFSWRVVSSPDGSRTEFSNRNASITTFTGDTSGEYIVQLLVSDGEDGALSNTTVTISPRTEDPSNRPPVAIDSECNFVVNGSILCEVSGTDPDGDQLQFRIIEQPVPLPGASIVTMRDSGFVSQDARTRYSVRYRDLPDGSIATESVALFVANDGFKDSEPATMTWNLRNIPSNEPRPYPGIETEILSDEYAPATNTFSYQFADDDTMIRPEFTAEITKQPAGSNVTINISPAGSYDSSTAGVTAPRYISDLEITADLPGDYEFMLRTSDGEALAYDSGDASLIDYDIFRRLSFTLLADNEAPIAQIQSVNEVQLGELISFSGASSNDPDGDAITYRWVLLQSPDSSSALIEGNGSEVTLLPDVAGNYEIQLIVNDGTLDSEAATASVTVLAIVDPNNTPPVAVAGENRTVATNTFVVLPGYLSYDEDINQTLSASWALVAAPAGFTGQINFPDAPDAVITLTVPGDYEFSLTVSDGQLTSTANTKIAVVDIDSLAPADPGEVNFSTTLGVDADADGVRDDVQRLLMANYQNQPNLLNAYLQLARVIDRQMLYSFGGQESLAQIAVDAALAVECIGAQDANYGDGLWTTYYYYANTLERKETMDIYEDALHRSVLVHNPVDIWLDSCEFILQ